MNISDLKKFELLYLATPFTLYGAGLEAAHIDASEMMAGLLSAGIYNVISPIVEAYPIAWHGKLDPLDLAIWNPFCAARMAKCDALIVGMLDGWETSMGTRHEIGEFHIAHKPVFFMNPEDLSFT